MSGALAVEITGKSSRVVPKTQGDLMDETIRVLLARIQYLAERHDTGMEIQLLARAVRDLQGM